MATYLETSHWKPNTQEEELTARINDRRLNRFPPNYEVPYITTHRLRHILQQFHAHKAPGPDALEAELFKHMPENALEIIADHINDWIRSHHVDTEQLKARVASLFKKGDFKNAENYRPISLLNTIYKLKARILKDAIEQGIERELQSTQYAFWKTAVLCSRFIASDVSWTRQNERSSHWG